MAEYTAKEVFAEANRHGDHVADMLTAYAERIAADEGAVPIAVASVMPGTAGFTMAVFNAADVPAGTDVYLRPPARAAQVDLQKVFDALHRSSPLPEIIRHVPGAERLHHEAHAMVRDALAAQSTAEPVAQGEAVAWHLRIGSSNIWSVCDTEALADFYGRQSGTKYEKRPLYTTPPAQPAEPVVAWMTPGGDVSRSWLWATERCQPGQKPAPLYIAPHTRPTERVVEGCARYIDTGNARWDSAAFQAWREGSNPGSDAWIKRIRELLTADQQADR